MSGRRIRVAYLVSPSVHFAGIERVVHEIASGLAERHGDVLDVHVVFGSDYDEAVLAATPYTRHVLGVDRLRAAATALRALVATLDLDVLICPQVEATVTAWLATRGLGLPVLAAHLHGNPRLEQDEGTWRTRAAFALFRRVVAPRLGGVLAVSPSLGRYAATVLAPSTPVLVAPNPVRDLPPAPVPGPPGGPVRFLSVGRLSRQKGQDLLLRALALARPALPPVRLTLVGTGDEEPVLRALCRDLRLDDVVEFAGYTSDPSPYFAAADCFVLPSRWEGFGVVLVEALHFGLPILAADCAFGPSDVVTEAALGDLVAPDDAVALAAGLRRAAATAAAAGTTAAAGDDEARARRRAVAGSYRRDEVVDTHLDVLRRLAAAGAADSAPLTAFAASAGRG